MSEEAGTDSSHETDNNDTLDPDTQREYRERVIELAFGGDQKRFDEFLRVLRDATPAGVEVILRGSAVTGRKWKTDEPFDANGPGTSDLDVTFVGGDMVMLFREFHIPGIHSVPLSEAHPFASPPLAPLRQRLSQITQRAVNLQATTSLVQSLREVSMDQPYLVLLKQPKAEDD
jgi:predicted nucleotidyltransferase